MRKTLRISFIAVLLAFALPVCVTYAYGNVGLALRAPNQPDAEETPPDATEAAPREVFIPTAAFIAALGGQSGDTFAITKRGADGGVEEAAFAGRNFTAAELAALFNLSSQHFTLRSEGGFVVFTSQ